MHNVNDAYLVIGEIVAHMLLWSTFCSHDSVHGHTTYLAILRKAIWKIFHLGEGVSVGYNVDHTFAVYICVPFP